MARSFQKPRVRDFSKCWSGSEQYSRIIWIGSDQNTRIRIYYVLYVYLCKKVSVFEILYDYTATAAFTVAGLLLNRHKNIILSLFTVSTEQYILNKYAKCSNRPWKYFLNATNKPSNWICHLQRESQCEWQIRDSWLVQLHNPSQSFLGRGRVSLKFYRVSQNLPQIFCICLGIYLLYT